MRNYGIVCKVRTGCFIIPFFLSACHPATHTIENNTVTVGKRYSENEIDATKSIFPMANYSQSVDRWISPGAEENNIPVIDDASQNHYFLKLKSRYFGMGEDGRSPWKPDDITAWMDGNKSVQKILDDSREDFLDTDSHSWGENFREHTAQWKEDVRNNAAVSVDSRYRSTGRAIIIRETLVRMLPTADPAFGDPRQAGQGYPFDNLQDSSIQPGTPVYVLANSKDNVWQFVASPSVEGWVRSDDIAGVDQQFISTWVSLADKKLGAFIKEPVSVQDGNRFYFTARPGTILPYKEQQSGFYLVAVPVKQNDGNAKINWVKIDKGAFTAMPWKMTPNNIAYLMKSMIGKPYGWGNYNFYNDCSAEMRSLMMPFGIFLPRNSAEQIHEGRVVDLSKEDVSSRINYLKKNGKPFTTLVYITGHIMLYIGNTSFNGEEVPMTYQNLWGLRTRTVPGRSIIGGSAFLPVLEVYPEDPDLLSLADKEEFKLSFIE